MISTQFLQSCISGDEDAIQALVRAHQRGVFQLALSILDQAPGDPAVRPAAQAAPGAPATVAPASPDTIRGIAESAREAEVATRETFIAAIDRLGRYREDTPFDIWLYAIAIQVSQRRARRWKMRRRWSGFLQPLIKLVRRQLPEDWQEGTEQVPATYLQPADLELWSAVRGLDEKLRIPVVLRYYHDFPLHDIARMLRISEGAVHARLDAAREKILLSLEKEAQSPPGASPA